MYLKEWTPMGVPLIEGQDLQIEEQEEMDNNQSDSDD